MSDKFEIGIPYTFTCILCKDKINCLPDKKCRMCKCGETTIDYTPNYIRFIGVLPVEIRKIN